MLRRSKTDQGGGGATLYIGEPTVARLEAWRAALVGIGGDTGTDAFVQLYKGRQRAGSEPISGTALRRRRRGRSSAGPLAASVPHRTSPPAALWHGCDSASNAGPAAIRLSGDQISPRREARGAE